MGVGQIVDQNSDKKDACKVPIMWNSRLGLWGWWWKKMGIGPIVDQNSAKKDGCKVPTMMNSRLGLWRW